VVDLHSDAFDVRLLPKWLLPSLVGASLVIFGLWGRSCYLRHEVQQHTQQADQSRESAATHAAEGAVYDAQAQAQTDQLQADAAEVARLRAEVARLRRAAAWVPAPPPPASVPEPEPVLPPVAPAVDLAPLVERLDELVKAQHREIGGLKAQVATLTSARDTWKLTAQDSGREALQLRAALAAQQGLTRNALWKGRLQGLAVGFATGYVAGRLN